MRKPVVLSEHARFRMHLRRIPETIIEEVLAHPVVEARDTLTGYSIVVGKALYGRKDRMVVVVYEELEHYLEIVTIHPIRAGQYRMRLQRGRWKAK